MQLAHPVSAQDIMPDVHKALLLAAQKSLRLERRWNPHSGAPVFTVAGRYTARSWTQWTQGFQYGNAFLCFELTGDRALLNAARSHTLKDMADHLTHRGVHDHGFNNISTYGHLRRLMLSGVIERDEWELNFCELALKVSGAVQAARWTSLDPGFGYIYSFNGSHSLFIDTMRTLRICALAHTLGHTLLSEQDQSINLLERVVTHARTTAKFNLYFGEGRDAYDVPELRGRTVHEAVFNPASRAFRCPSSQQGYSPFSTWTRGLAWAMLGFSEQLEFLQSLPAQTFEIIGDRTEILHMLERSARAACDFYLTQGSARDGICYWDTGAPQLHRLGDWRNANADPYNDFEPVDSSASAIASQGLLRLGHLLGQEGSEYTAAGLAIVKCLLREPYLSVDPNHEGLLLHSIYHRPNGWDYIPPGAKIPYGESSMWGDYHFLEALLLVSKLAQSKYYTFFEA